MEVIDELCSFEGRLAGTDAERRAANSVAERLRKQGRRVEVESTYVHPQLGLILGLHCAMGLTGSLIGVAAPKVAFALVLIAATSLYLDLNARFYLLRRLFFRRVSQNIVARNPATAREKHRLLLCAHVDAAKTGLVYKPGRLDRFVRLFRFLGIEVTPPRLIFWSLAVLIPILGARAAGLDNNGIALLQLLPTLVLLLACFALIELELSPVVPGANDDASGVATALSLAEELDRTRPRNLDVWVVVTGGEECLFEGMRSFLRRHADELKSSSTWIVNINSVGRGDVRYATAEGLAVSFDFRSRLTQVCEAIADSDREDGENRYRASAVKHGFATDALAARVRKLKATTITCIEPKAIAPANYHLPSDVPAAIDPEAIERAHDFTLAVIRTLDADLGRTHD